MECVLLALGIFAPQRIDDAIDRHDLIGIGQEQRQERSLLVGAQVDLDGFGGDLEGSQRVELKLCHACLFAGWTQSARPRFQGT